jgi:hypothetical protein
MYHINSSNYVRPEVLIAVTMKITVFWHVLAYSLADCYQCFGESCCHLQSRGVGKAWKSGRYEIQGKEGPEPAPYAHQQEKRKKKA